MWRRILENGGQGVLPRIVTIENTQIMCLVSQRSKATVAVNSSSNNDYDDEWKTAKPFEEIPGYRSYPIVGTMWSMLPVIGTGVDVTRLMEHSRITFKKFGPFWKDYFPGFKYMVTTTRPEDAKKLFQMEGKYPERPPAGTVVKYRAEREEHYTSSGILNSSGESWYKIRSKIQQPMLKPKNMENYIPVLGEISDEFIDRIRLIRQKHNNEMKPDFINEMYRWALESVGVVALDTRLGCLSPNITPDSEAQKMIDAANTSLSVLPELEFGIPFWKYFNTPKLKKLYGAHDFFTDIATKYINRIVEKIEKRPADSEEGISILEELFIRGVTPKDALVMIIDMLMAGIDTTSHSTSFLLYYLAKNPRKQEKLREEILSVVGPKGSPVTASNMKDLHYLRACVKETMRVLPATMGNGRIIDKDMVLSGYRVPKGTTVIVHHQLMGELEEYFPRPNEFLPERWIKGDPLESHHHPFTLLPFGFGTRMCVGRRLAEMEMWQFTTKVMQNFRVEYHHKDIKPLNRFVNGPDQPLRFQFIDLPSQK